MTAPVAAPPQHPAVVRPAPHHPVVVAHQRARAADLQLRIADGITAFAGSMTFVYLHAGLFALWMLVFEADPWPKLTLIVSLEAIFLSTNTELTREIRRLTEEIHRSVVHPASRSGRRRSSPGQYVGTATSVPGCTARARRPRSPAVT